MIPARGGSKRVAHKNLRVFRGKSLLDWAMAHADGSKHIDHWVVSTEDKEIARLAGRRAIARPAYLAGDKTPTEGVLVHALYTLPGYDFAVLLQPTSPMRTVEDIDRCIEIAIDSHEKYGITGCVSYNPWGKRNGAVYVCQVEHFLQFLSLDASHHYEMDVARSLDIDYDWDFPAKD